MYIYAYFLKAFTFPQNFCAEFFSFGLHASVPIWFPNGKQTNKQNKQSCLLWRIWTQGRWSWKRKGGGDVHSVLVFEILQGMF